MAPRSLGMKESSRALQTRWKESLAVSTGQSLRGLNWSATL
jgi:hypothetical protein